MEQRHWEVNNHSASQEILCLLQNLKVCSQKRTLLVPILSQMNLVHIFLPYFPKICPNKLLYVLRSSEWSLPFRFSTNNVGCVFHLQSMLHVLLNFNPLDLITLIIFCETYKLWSSSLCGLPQPPVTSFLIGPNILLSTLFSNTFNLCSSHNTGYQVTHTHFKEKLCHIFRDFIMHPYNKKLKSVLCAPLHPEWVWDSPRIFSIRYYGFFPAGLRWLQRDTDHLFPSCAELKNVWSFTSTPLHPSMI